MVVLAVRAPPREEDVWERVEERREERTEDEPDDRLEGIFYKRSG